MSVKLGPRKPKHFRLEDILNNNVWDVDQEPHIRLYSERCVDCPTKACLRLCPAECFTLLEGRVLFSYEGCLECGTCRVVCPKEAIEWNYPVSGRGIHYRFS